MAGVSVAEYGLGFVKACMEQYWGSCLLPLLYAAGLLWSVISRRRKEAAVFLGYTVFLFLTVYNPFLVRYIIPKMGFENEYYRFLWALPVIPGAAYFAVRLVFSVKNRAARAVLAAVCAAVFVFAGEPISGIADHFSMVENIYKVPDDLRAACSVIHQDSEKENPRVVFDNPLNNVARQYDASLQLVLNRDVILYRAGSTVVGPIDEESLYYRVEKALIDVAHYEEEIPMRTFRAALRMSRTDYLVLPVNMANHAYIRKAGCTPIAQTENYVVYRCDYENV